MENKVQVVVGGKVLTVWGSKDEVTMQQVASCVNKMTARLEATQSFRHLPTDLRPLLIELNLAEELIAERETSARLKEDLQEKENELARVKQELVEAELRLERLEGKKRR